MLVSTPQLVAYAECRNYNATIVILQSKTRGYEAVVVNMTQKGVHNSEQYDARIVNTMSHFYDIGHRSSQFASPM